MLRRLSIVDSDGDFVGEIGGHGLIGDRYHREQAQRERMRKDDNIKYMILNHVDEYEMPFFSCSHSLYMALRADPCWIGELTLTACKMANEVLADRVARERAEDALYEQERLEDENHENREKRREKWLKEQRAKDAKTHYGS